MFGSFILGENVNIRHLLCEPLYFNLWINTATIELTEVSTALSR